MDVLVRSSQDLGTLLARSCHGIHFDMVRSYQESNVPKKYFHCEIHFDQKKSESKARKINISADLHC